MDRQRQARRSRHAGNAAAAAIAVFALAAGTALRQDAAATRSAPLHAAAATPCEVRPPHLGREVSVSVPEVWELANIALSLTDWTASETHTTWRSGDYHAAVLRHFGPYREHPLVRRLDEVLAGPDSWRGYYAFRESSAAYTFAADGRIQRATHRNYWPEDGVAPLLPLLHEFAEHTRFRDFYREHTATYEEQTARYHAMVPLLEMWDWLEERFPQRYARYDVVFSPLVHGSHSTQRFPGERSMTMFVAGPGVVLDRDSATARRSMARMIFTEIDHNYVNPTTDSHAAAVHAAFADVAWWNDNPAGPYATPYAVFNEYMTFAVYALYLAATDAAAETAIADIEAFMERRGFSRFAAFNRALLRVAAAHGHGCVPQLYPAVLEWAAAHAGTHS